MNKHDFELLKEEFERDIELIEDKLEKKANALNAMAYNVVDGFAFWDEYGRKTKKLIKESQELWIQKSFIEKKLEKLVENEEQSSLDEYSEEDEEDIPEEDIDNALEEMEDKEGEE